MKKSTLIFLIIIGVILLGIFFLIFKDNNSIKEVRVDMDNITLRVGEKKAIKLEIIPENSVYDSITYSVSDNNIISVDNNGNVEAKNPGNAKIDIIIQKKILKTINVLVIDNEKEKNITITNGNITLNEGEEISLNINKNTDDNIIWECDSNILSCSNGQVKAIKEGTSSVTARCEKDDCLSTITVTVKKKSIIIEEKDIQIDKTTISMYQGDKINLNVEVLPTDSTYKEIRYLSLNNNIASVSDNGVVTGIKEGTTIIEVSTTYKKITKKVNVTVLKNSDVTLDYPTSIFLNKTNLTINVGEKYILSATINPSNVKNKAISWISSDKNIVTVNNDGGITGVKEGIATISAITGNMKIAKCFVRVVNNTTEVDVNPSKIELNKTNTNMKVGDALTLIATITPVNAKNKTITWTSSNTAVATVNTNGVVTSKKEGEVTITAETSNGKRATCKIVVINNSIPVTKIALNKTSINLVYGKNITLTKTITPSNATSIVTWESANTNIATVDQNGKITAKKVGTTKIIVKSDNGIKAECAVTISPYIKEDKFPYRYQDETADLTIEKKTYTSSINNKKTVYYQAHLILKDYERLNTGLTRTVKHTDGKYLTAKISQAASKAKAIFALQGDEKANTKTGSIRNGVRYSIENRDLSKISPKTFALGCYSKKTGILDSCAKVSAKNMQEAVNTSEVTDTFKFGGDLLIDGVNQYKTQADKTNRPRQANFIGYVKPGEFYFIVSEGLVDAYNDIPSDGISYGFTRYEKGELLKNLGCRYGTQLDGGGSIIVWFRGKQLQSKAVIKDERDFLTDFIYFK